MGHPMGIFHCVGSCRAGHPSVGGSEDKATADLPVMRVGAKLQRAYVPQLPKSGNCRPREYVGHQPRADCPWSRGREGMGCVAVCNGMTCPDGYTKHEAELLSAHLQEEVVANRNWEVIQHSGQHMILQCGSERRDIKRPSEPTAREFFMSIRPGQLIDDATLVSLLGVKL